MNTPPPTPPQPPSAPSDQRRPGPRLADARGSTRFAGLPPQVNDEEFDALTDLFIGDLAKPRSASTQQHSSTPIEARGEDPNTTVETSPADHPSSDLTVAASPRPPRPLRLRRERDWDASDDVPLPSPAGSPSKNDVGTDALHYVFPIDASRALRPREESERSGHESTAEPVTSSMDVSRTTDESESPSRSFAFPGEIATTLAVTGAEPQSRRQPVIECVVLGHLPVFASAWATQYVREVAQAAGRAVAVLRVQHGYASVEVIQTEGDLAAQNLGECDDLESAITIAASITDRWILRCDAGDEPLAASRDMVRVVTLLSSADEMAMIGAYASIKALSAHLTPPTEDAHGPRVRVAIMGTSGDSARVVGDKLAHAVRAFLAREIEQVVCSARIGSSRSPAMLFSGECEQPLAVVLDTVERALLGPETDISAHAWMSPVSPTKSGETLIENLDAEIELADPIWSRHDALTGAEHEAAVPPRTPIAPAETHTFPPTVARIESGVEATREASADSTRSFEELLAQVPLPDPVSTFTPQPTQPIHPSASEAETSTAHERADSHASPARSAPVPHRVATPITRAVALPTAPPLSPPHSPKVAAIVEPWSGRVPAAGVQRSAQQDRSPLPEPKQIAGPSNPFPVPPQSHQSQSAPHELTRERRSLCEHIAGLRALPVRCPFAESVEIATDPSGAMHLLAHGTNAGEDDRLLAALMIASSWAFTNASLLAFGSSSPLDHSRQPVMHLFTDQPKRSRRLLDTSVRVHLLAPVSVDGRSAWFCTELN